MTEKSKLLAVGGGEDEIGYGGKRGFSGQIGAKTVLGWGKEGVFGHIEELLLYDFLYNVGESWDD